MLTIDELGLQMLDRRDAHLLFKVLFSGNERASTILTSNKSIREWPEMMAGREMLATVILDRLRHHRHVAKIDGRSFRLREVQASTALGAPSRHAAGQVQLAGRSEQGARALRPASLRSPGLRSVAPCSNPLQKGGNRHHLAPRATDTPQAPVRESGWPLTAGIWVYLAPLFLLATPKT